MALPLFCCDGVIDFVGFLSVHSTKVGVLNRAPLMYIRLVFHWYTGTSSVLRDIVNQGYFISATPAVEYHEEHRRAIKEALLERLLLETDSPVVYRRGSEFEYESRPADILRSLRGAAELKSVSEAQLAEVTTDNALSFFCL